MSEERLDEELQTTSERLQALEQEYRSDKRAVKAVLTVFFLLLAAFFGISYYQIGQLVNNALEELAVDEVKTAVDEINSLIADAQEPAFAGETVIYGSIYPDGRPKGSGFESRKIGKGDYEVTFDVPFEEDPVLILSSGSEFNHDFDNFPGYYEYSANKFRVKTWDVGSNGNTPDDGSQITFIAIGRTNR